MKIAIVGCGRIANTHARILKKSVPAAQLVFCDRNQDKADDFASKHSSPGGGYTDFESLLNQEQPAAAHILTHPSSHKSYAAAALEAGAHVFIEKPITESLADFDDLQALAEGKKKILYPGYSTLGYPIIGRASALIQSGRLGGLISAHCDFNVGPALGRIPYGNKDHWAYSLEGGILHNVVDHPMSLLADAIDNPSLQSVCIRRRADLPQNTPNLMHAVVANSKQIGSFTLSYGNGNAFAFVNYFLEAGTIRVDLRNFTMMVEPGAGPVPLLKRAVTGMRLGAGLGFGALGTVWSRATGKTSVNPGIKRLIENFYAVIDNKAQPIVSAETTRDVVRLLDNVWATAGNGAAQDA